MRNLPEEIQQSLANLRLTLPKNKANDKTKAAKTKMLWEVSG
jgi:hypothetical protein